MRTGLNPLKTLILQGILENWEENPTSSATSLLLFEKKEVSVSVELFRITYGGPGRIARAATADIPVLRLGVVCHPEVNPEIGDVKPASCESATRQKE